MNAFLVWINDPRQTKTQQNGIRAKKQRKWQIVRGSVLSGSIFLHSFAILFRIINNNSFIDALFVIFNSFINDFFFWYLKSILVKNNHLKNAQTSCFFPYNIEWLFGSSFHSGVMMSARNQFQLDREQRKIITMPQWIYLNSESWIVMMPNRVFN